MDTIGSDFAVTAVENLHSPNSTNVISSVCLRRVPLAASLNLSSEHHPVTTPQQPGSVIRSPRAYSVRRRTICCTHTLILACVLWCDYLATTHTWTTVQCSCCCCLVDQRAPLSSLPLRDGLRWGLSLRRLLANELLGSLLRPESCTPWVALAPPRVAVAHLLGFVC